MNCEYMFPLFRFCGGLSELTWLPSLHCLDFRTVAYEVEVLVDNPLHFTCEPFNWAV